MKTWVFILNVGLMTSVLTINAAKVQVTIFSANDTFARSHYSISIQLLLPSTTAAFHNYASEGGDTKCCAWTNQIISQADCHKLRNEPGMAMIIHLLNIQHDSRSLSAGDATGFNAFVAFYINCDDGYREREYCWAGKNSLGPVDLSITKMRYCQYPQCFAQEDYPFKITLIPAPVQLRLETDSSPNSGTELDIYVQFALVPWLSSVEWGATDLVNYNGTFTPGRRECRTWTVLIPREACDDNLAKWINVKITYPDGHLHIWRLRYANLYIKCGTRAYCWDRWFSPAIEFVGDREFHLPKSANMQWCQSPTCFPQGKIPWYTDPAAVQLRLETSGHGDAGTVADVYVSLRLVNNRHWPGSEFVNFNGSYTPGMRECRTWRTVIPRWACDALAGQWIDVVTDYRNARGDTWKLRYVNLYVKCGAREYCFDKWFDPLPISENSNLHVPPAKQMIWCKSTTCFAESEIPWT